MKKYLIFPGFIFATHIFAQPVKMIISTDLKQQTVVSEPSTIRKGFLRTSIYSHFTLVDRLFNEDGKRSYYAGSLGWSKNWYYMLGVSYGLIDRIQLGFDISYANENINSSILYLYPGIDSSSVQYFNYVGRGFGDIDLAINYQIIDREEGKTSLMLQLTPVLPTGRKNPENIKSTGEFDIPTGQGHVSLDTRLIFRKIIYPYSYSAFASYRYNFKASKIQLPGEEEVPFKTGGLLYLGGSFNLHLNDWIALLNEFDYTGYGNDKFYGTTNANAGLVERYTLNYQPSLVFQIRKLRFTESATFPFIGKNIGADPTYIFALQYIF